MSALDLPSARVMLPWLLPLWFCAAGPAQFVIIAAVASRDTDVSVSETSRPWRRPALSESSARGPGQFDAAVRRSIPPSPCKPAPFVSDVRALGQDEEPFAPHGVASFRRAEYSDRNAAAQSLQCWDSDSELPVGVPRDVLAEEGSSPALIVDVDGAVEKPAIVEFAAALSRNAVSLARIARSDDIHESTPCCAVEGSSVRPDRSRMKPPRFHRRDQARGGCGFPLHVADASDSLSAIIVGEAQSEFEASDPGADGEDVDGSGFKVGT